MNDDLIERIKALNINQKELVSKLIDEITSDTVKTAPILTNQIVNHNLPTKEGTPLAIGDRVRILNNRKTGKNGDIATIVKFNKIYVAIKLDKNRSHTQRSSKNLELIL